MYEIHIAAYCCNEWLRSVENSERRSADCKRTNDSTRMHTHIVEASYNFAHDEGLILMIRVLYQCLILCLPAITGYVTKLRLIEAMVPHNSVQLDIHSSYSLQYIQGILKYKLCCFKGILSIQF